jgi:hypothetical protein
MLSERMIKKRGKASLMLKALLSTWSFCRMNRGTFLKLRMKSTKEPSLTTRVIDNPTFAKHNPSIYFSLLVRRRLMLTRYTFARGSLNSNPFITSAQMRVSRQTKLESQLKEWLYKTRKSACRVTVRT